MVKTSRRDTLSIRLNEVEREKLKKIADELGCSLGEAARLVIIKYKLKEQKDANNARKT